MLVHVVDSGAAAPRSGTAARWATALTVGLLAVVVVRCAWVSDDAYFTFRTVENLVSGHGPRFNVAERVQAYTHPLWMLCLAGVRAFHIPCYWGSLILSFACTAAVALLLARVRPAGAGILPLAVLACSKSFVDYATSGLENTLGHLLVLVFCLLWLGGISNRARVWPLGLTVSLMVLNRLDTVLLVAPALGLLVVERRSWRVTAQLALSALPLVIWEAFSLVYYGALVPNTYYAKLSADTPWSEALAGGWTYLVESSRYDHLTVLVIVAAGALALARRQLTLAALAAGMLTYVAYIVWIGGDFMAGRFLTLPLVVAAAILTVTGPRWGSPVFGLCVAAVLVLSLSSPRSPLLSGPNYSRFAPESPKEVPTGMVDERAYYFRERGMLRSDLAEGRNPFHPPGAGEDGRIHAARVEGFGNGAFTAPLTQHIVNPYGLSDPLLARLQPSPGCRVGHPLRPVPEGYLESLDSGETHILDPDVAALYEDVQTVVAGPLWTRERWKAIGRLSTGAHEVGRMR